LQDKLKWYIRQSTSNWLRNEIRKSYGDNTDAYLEKMDEINKIVDKTADEMIENLEEQSEVLLTVYRNQWKI